MTSRQFILNFHGIGTPPAHIDADERPYWIGSAQFEAIVDMVSAHRCAPQVKWTFDDGNISDLTIAAPALAARRLSGAFFILTGRLKTPGYLGGADIQALLDMNMAVGLHGADHIDWRKADADRLKLETIHARDDLANIIGRPVTEVAVPFGAYDRRVMAHLVRSGFDRIFTSDGGPTFSRARICSRMSVRDDMAMSTIVDFIENRETVRRKIRRLASCTLRRYII